MNLHIIKLAVGIEDVDHLATVQALRLKQALDGGGPAILRHVTRNTPRRAAELLDGGSMYWVIKGAVRVRQRLVGVEAVTDPEEGPRCALILDPRLAPTVLRPHRAFQGWRYLRPEDAPPDAAARTSETGMPDHMVTELKELGLL
jgi:hypothetical protein